MPMPASASLIHITNLSKTYAMGGRSLDVLDALTFSVHAGDFIAVMGPSGSGKSTLLNILGCLDRATAGTYLLEGIDISRASDDRLSEIRGRTFGFVFQSFHLIDNLNVYDNVTMPFLYAPAAPANIHKKTVQAIESVGLADRMQHHPHELSGGEMQRVAIARAIVNQPKIILADEPTGNLDSATGTAIMKLLKNLNRNGTTLILVTHDHEIAAWAGRTMTLRDGQFI
jgi:putative ABC transport system ATP-binding protein